MWDVHPLTEFAWWITVASCLVVAWVGWHVGQQRPSVRRGSWAAGFVILGFGALTLTLALGHDPGPVVAAFFLILEPRWAYDVVTYGLPNLLQGPSDEELRDHHHVNGLLEKHRDLIKQEATLATKAAMRSGGGELRRALWESPYILFISVRADRTIRRYEGGGLRSLGHLPGQKVDQVFAEIFPEASPGAESALQGVVSTRILTHDGRTYQALFTPVFDSFRNVKHVDIHMQDITHGVLRSDDDVHVTTSPHGVVYAFP